MKSPKWGPGFQSIDSNLYRAEYAGLFLGILVYLVWKGAGLAGGAATIYWSSFVFWLILPDVASFIPIGLLSKGGRWPSWGAPLQHLSQRSSLWARLCEFLALPANCIPARPCL